MKSTFSLYLIELDKDKPTLDDHLRSSRLSLTLIDLQTQLQIGTHILLCDTSLPVGDNYGRQIKSSIFSPIDLKIIYELDTVFIGSDKYEQVLKNLLKSGWKEISNQLFNVIGS